MENNIKLTNFTKSKEIRSFLERQFPQEFNMIVNGKSITAVKSMNLISLITNTFKNYPSFRIYFTGYTKDELESIVNLINTMDMNSPNPIRTKIASSLSTDELKDFIADIFELEDTRIKLPKSKFGNKPGLPSNVSYWLNGNGYHCLEDAKKVSRWYNKLTGGRNFVGGTSIGKSPQTLILDITSNSSDVYINGYEGGITVCGITVETYKEFCDAISTKYIIM